MASRNQPFAPIGQYRPLHISAVSQPVNTTSATTITAGPGVVVTPVSMANIFVGTVLHFSGGTGTAEDVMVTAITGTTFTATFANNHSGAYTITTPAAQLYIPVGNCVSTTSGTTIVAGTDVTVTPASIKGMQVGQLLNVANGTGTAEDVRVKAVDPTLGTFRADFLYNHSGAYTITSRCGTFFGGITVNQPGTTISITLYNGSPNLVPLPSSQGVIGIPQPAAVGMIGYPDACDLGLFYTVAGSAAGDYTLHYLDMEV